MVRGPERATVRRPYRRAAASLAVAALTTATVAIAAAANGAAAGRVFYVAPTGSDSAAGTLSAPWKSIAHAQSVAQAGDTVYFRGGTYAYTHATRSCTSGTDRVDAITLNKSGSSGNAISYIS